MDNVEEMDKFLEMYNVQRLNQEEIWNMNRPTESNEIERKKVSCTVMSNSLRSHGL